MDENHPCFTQGLSTVPKIGNSFKEEIFSAIDGEGLRKCQRTRVIALMEIKLDRVMEVPDRCCLACIVGIH